MGSGQAVVSWVVGQDPGSSRLLSDQSRLIRKLRGWYGRAGGLGGLKGKGFPFLQGLPQIRMGCFGVFWGFFPFFFLTALLVLPMKGKKCVFLNLDYFECTY